MIYNFLTLYFQPVCVFMHGGKREGKRLYFNQSENLNLFICYLDQSHFIIIDRVRVLFDICSPHGSFFSRPPVFFCITLIYFMILIYFSLLAKLFCCALVTVSGFTIHV